MKNDDIKIIAVKDGNGYTVWLNGLPGLIVQVDSLSEAPKALAKSFEALMVYSFRKLGVKEYDYS